MKRFALLLIIISILCISAQQNTVKIAVLKYGGGGDWYANPTALPNLIKFCNENLPATIDEEVYTVEVGSADIFNYPFVHLTGHGNVVFSDSEAKNLRKYLTAGGFLHIDDNYGLDKYIRREMKKVFPEQDFVEIPFDHLIYNQKYKFDKGLPKIHEHDGKPPKGYGIFYKNNLVCFYSHESDIGDGWEDVEIHNDSYEVRQKALKMGANIISYAFLY